MLRFCLAIILGFISLRSVQAAELGSFDGAVSRFKTQQQCKQGKITAASYGLGRLYGCILGKAETAKFFINEEPSSGDVKNIKVMWNDWFVDVGYGVHADQKQAEQLARILARMYAPHLEKDLVRAMQQDKDATVAEKGMVFRYTFRPGPKINERLITVSAK